MADSDRSGDPGEEAAAPQGDPEAGGSRRTPECRCHEESDRGVVPSRVRKRMIVEVILWIIRIALELYGTGG
ncbi:hypothetical protein [Streptomyces hesseae]|uniref:Transposase n=1 Tax=Streptomyces hesseae TaxID=3075519 RepID=A0ABU2SVS2_9ACTN|nr:hypothetical protein [Streptomyces sp. DSM 40473]MDT0452105.1 hypothetical protein [Streptomyces sp. DSM 40473]